MDKSNKKKYLIRVIEKKYLKVSYKNKGKFFKDLGNCIVKFFQHK